jgi:hypothetical protein
MKIHKNLRRPTRLTSTQFQKRGAKGAEQRPVHAKAQEGPKKAYQRKSPRETRERPPISSLSLSLSPSPGR